MKELKVLIVVLICIGALYWGVEPYAHTKLHPHTSAVNFDFAAGDNELAKENIAKAEAALEFAKSNGDEKMISNANRSLQKTKDQQDKIALFWNDVNKIDLSKGDAMAGAEAFAMACTACHGLEAASLTAPVDGNLSSEMYGVNPPDLSTAGYLYTDKFLAAIILNPAMAMKVDHKFNDENPHPMTQFFGLGGELNQEVADIVAYLKSVAPKTLDDKKVFADACQRCHDVKYDKTYMSSLPNFLSKYMGSTPPDLSMMIRSKQADYLHKFINDPQKMLPATSMPRVGLNEQAQTQIVEYIEKVGDSKKAERESLSVYIMIYFAILAVFATLWKRKIWSKLH